MTAWLAAWARRITAALRPFRSADPEWTPLDGERQPASYAQYQRRP